MLLKSFGYQIASKNQKRGYRITGICKSNSNIGQRYVLRVSTTRGVPSTSTNLKEALCEKIPVHYDLLRNFRKEHGQSVISRITVDNVYDGLQGVNTMVRETSENDSKYGIRYRGLTIPEVLNLLPRNGTSPSVEAVFWLLLTGDVPTQEQTNSLINDWSSRRQRRKEWWSGPGGGIVGSVLQNLPDNVTPLARLSIALTVLQTDKHTKKALQNGALNHTHWEHIYEDSMELLAALPAIIGLVGKGRELRNVTEGGDWIDFLLECLSNTSEDLKGRTTSVGDFLRLYVSLNADEDGGVPGVHITQISGASYLDISQALASGVLVYENEPITGTMFQYMEFQEKVKSILGTKPKEETLKDFLTSFIKENKLIGHKETRFLDSRYTALLNHVKTYLPGDAEVKLSQDITRVLTFLMKNTKNKNIFPEVNSIAAPMFQFYGLKDMKFNQVLLCMSRALGAIASIIWTRAINAPIEQPKSNSTYTYFYSLRDIRNKMKKRTRIKHLTKFTS
ncbi:probable citrate synthase, mitochondrial [Vespa crabro]|uniref:probable citrate synthase, mitochondrial n=1 Tax=Vespa crabro TaxID=7445 RepID=UPI001F01AE8F|nr:probable citrate synthase, mitochondrial [Vespa crabro]